MLFVKQLISCIFALISSFYRRFGAKYAEEIYRQQPLSTRVAWNRLHYRPLEGFVYAGIYM